MTFLSPEAWARWGDHARQLWDLLALSIEPGPDAALWFLERVEIVAREEERAMTMARHILAGEMLAQLDVMLEALIEAGLTGKIVAEGRFLGRVETLRAADWLRWQQMPRELRRRAFDFRRDQLHSLQPGVPPIEAVAITITRAPAIVAGAEREPGDSAEPDVPPPPTREQAPETPQKPPPLTRDGAVAKIIADGKVPGTGSKGYSNKAFEMEVKLLCGLPPKEYAYGFDRRSLRRIYDKVKHEM